MECRVCGNKKDNSHYTIKEMMFGFNDEFDYFQCKECNCLQISEFPENIAKYYPEQYHSFENINEREMPPLKKSRIRSTIFRKGLFQQLLHGISPAKQYKLFNVLKVKESSSMLDVGCGSGYFFQPLKSVGFDNVLGIDPFIKASHQYQNGFEVKKQEIFGMEGKWDYIFYNHSFEHIPNPLENLKKVASLLNPGGACVIRVPTASSYAWEHYRTNWVQLDAPRHFFLHSVESMKILAEKSGLVYEDEIYESLGFQFSGSEQYEKGIPLHQKEKVGFFGKIQNKLKKRKFKKMAKQLNKEKRGDQAAFILRKAKSE